MVRLPSKLIVTDYVLTVSSILLLFLDAMPSPLLTEQ